MPNQPQTLNQLFGQNIGTWYFRTDNYLRVVLATQAAAAKRNIEPLHFFRLRRDKSGFDAIRGQIPPEQMHFDPPTQARLSINVNSQTAEMDKGGVDQKIVHTITIDLAECIRLGEYYKTTDVGINFYFYLPSPGDVYQYNYSLFVIEDVSSDQESYYKPLRRYVTWKGQSKLFRTDASSPDIPLLPIQQPKIEQPTWVV